MSAALDGLRVIELGRMVAAPYAARLLADFGADCVKVEPSHGDPMRRRETLFAYLNANKRGATLGLAGNAAAAALRGLLVEADVFINDLQPREAAALGLTYSELSALNPRLVCVAVTPFGLSGPQADLPANELTLWAASGYAQLTPAGGRREGGRPLKPAGFQAGFMAGAAAALAAMAALAWRARSGRGQLADVSVQEVLICANDPTFAPYLARREVVPSRLVASSFEFLPCKDGAVSMLLVRDDQWQRLVELMGNPDWAQSELFAGFGGRREHWDALAPLLCAFFAQYTAQELYRLAQARRIPLAPVNSAADVLASAHLRARGAFVDLPLPEGATLVAPGPPVRLTRTPANLRFAAPPAPIPPESEASDGCAALWPPIPGEGEIDEPGCEANGGDSDLPSPRIGRGAGGEGRALTPGASRSAATAPSPSAPLPLQQVRVLDFTWVWAGPQASRFLADLGAEVIKVESDRRIDNYRTIAAPDGSAYGINASPGFNALNRNKLSVRIDLRAPAGRALALQLAAVCDLVIENFAPRVLPGLGLGWAAFAAVNPRIVMLSMSGFGASGPERDNVLYGNSQVALCGLGHASGFPGGPAENIGMAHGDPVAAYHAAFAALVALEAARRDGLGQHVDMSQWETMLATAPEGVLALSRGEGEPARIGNRDPFAAPHGYFRCGDEAPDGRYLAIAVEGDAQWRALVELMGRPAWATASELDHAPGRLARVAELERRIEAWTATQAAESLLRRLRAAGVPAAPVATIADLADDGHLAARGFFETIAHPQAGEQRYVGVPFRLSETPPRLYRSAPLFGGDGGYVLNELLGLAEAETEHLAAAGVLH